MKNFYATTLAALVLTCLVSTAGAGELSVGSVKAAPGQPAVVGVTYTAEGKDAVAVASDISFNTNLFKNPRCESGSGLPADKSVRCATPKSGVLRIAIFGLNANAIASGEVAKITFDVAPNAKPGRYQLRNKPSAADKDGNDFKLKHSHGSVRVAKS